MFLIFSLIRAVFVYFFCFSVHKMFDSEYRTCDERSSEVRIRAVMKNQEMIKFVPYHLSTKKCVIKQLKITYCNEIAIPDKCKTK